ncbi:hypothetical protein G6F56_012414 [Rhizopus delemar]|nr:hypothetical protein G6F56_012414 [Rhizopus delemar]
MDFISYNANVELVLNNNSSLDEIDIKCTAQEYDNIETLIDFDSKTTELRAAKIEDGVDTLATQMKAVIISDNERKSKKYGLE